MTGEERAKIESALAGFKDAIKGDNKGAIETKLKALEEASGSVAQRLYAQQGGAAGAAAGGGQARAPRAATTMSSMPSSKR